MRHSRFSGGKAGLEIVSWREGRLALSTFTIFSDTFSLRNYNSSEKRRYFETSRSTPRIVPDETTQIDLREPEQHSEHIMLDNNSLAAVEKWIQSCNGLVPLEVSADHMDRTSQKTLIDSLPSLRGDWVEAILGLRIGAIDRAHEIVQHGSSAMDRYLHGVVHRIEGDFWNAKYWFRQVADRELFTRIGVDVMSALKENNAFEASKSFKIFDDQNRFAPQNFVDAQAALQAKSARMDRELIQRIAQAEWEAIWKIVKLRSSGG